MMKTIKLSFIIATCFAVALICSNAKADNIILAQGVDLGGLPADPFAAPPPGTVRRAPPPRPATTTSSGGSTHSQNSQWNEATGEPINSTPTQPQSPWTGTSTSWGDPTGQELIAPEVNVENMLTMTQQLRDLGYVIPESMDTAISNAPANMRGKIMGALHNIKNGGRGSVAATTTARIMRDLEAETGMSFENVLGNTFDILSGDAKKTRN